MAVAASPANDLSPAATAPTPPPVAMRAATPVCAGSYRYEGPDFETGWHSHDLHQIEYAFEGVVEVETDRARYLLPPQQAIWIPAGLAHRTTLRRVRTVAVFFPPEMICGADDRARVLAAAPVLREMIVYAARWPIGREPGDPVADAFFEALARLVPEWLDREAPLSLPTSAEPAVAAAIAYTNAHLETANVRGVCRAAGLSQRTLRRRFAAATGMSWRDYRLQSRLLRAMALLAESGGGVLAVGESVGFDSVSAFTRAFRRATGETPAAYRRRVTAGG